MLQQNLKALKAMINSLKLFKSLKSFTPKKMRKVALIIEWNFKDLWTSWEKMYFYRVTIFV